MLFCDEEQCKNETFRNMTPDTLTNARPALEIEQTTLTVPTLPLPVMAMSCRSVKGASEAVLFR